MKTVATSIFLALSVAVVGAIALRSQADSNSSATSDTYQADHFTIQLPAGLKATAYPREDSQTMNVFEDASGTKGFQVFTLPYAGPFTSNALQKAIPDLAISDLEHTSIAGEPASLSTATTATSGTPSRSGSSTRVCSTK